MKLKFIHSCLLPWPYGRLLAVRGVVTRVHILRSLSGNIPAYEHFSRYFAEDGTFHNLVKNYIVSTQSLNQFKELIKMCRSDTKLSFKSTV